MNGYKHTKEAKMKMSLAHKGKRSSNFGKRASQELRKKLSLAHKGKKPSEYTKKKMSNAHKKRWNEKPYRPREFRVKKKCENVKCKKIFEVPIKTIKLGRGKFCSRKCATSLTGQDSRHWKGGITPINQKIRGSLEYKLWEDSVKNRDGNHCQKCMEKKIDKLTCHHQFNFSSHPELRFAIDNGITLCRKCHGWFHRTYGIKNNTKKQILEFLNNENG